MIGTQIRGIKHLYKKAKEATTGLQILTILDGKYIQEYVVFPSKMDHNVLVFSNSKGYHSDKALIDNILDTHKKSAEELLKKDYSLYNSLDRITRATFCGYVGSYIIALPQSFNDDYNRFIKENHKATSQVFEKFIESSHPICKLAYCISNGNANFFAWAVKSIVKSHVSAHVIIHLLDFQTEYSNLVKETSKQNLIALSKPCDFTTTIVESFNLVAKTVAKQTLNWFNPLQKKMLREKLSNQNVVECLNKFSKLSKTKRLNFIRKVSTITDIDEIVNMMSYLCSSTHFEWNKDSFLTFLKHADGLSYEMVLDKDNVVVLRIHDFETIKRLAKTTNWCISKNKSYWDNYLECKKNGNDECSDSEYDEEDFNIEDEYDANFYRIFDNDVKTQNSLVKPMQFMVFDFDAEEDSVESIVGITIKNGVITSAHNFVNDNMMGVPCIDGDEIFNFDNFERIWQTEDKKEYISKINNFLKQKGINVSAFSKQTYSRCDWNRESVLDFISTIMHDDDFNILYDNDNRMLIHTKNRNMLAVFPNISQVFDNFDLDCYDAYVFFFDFTKSVNDTEKMLCWTIHTTRLGIEEPSNSCFDETFTSLYGENYRLNTLIEALSLPFDIISRPNTENYKLKVYLRERNATKIFEVLRYMKENGVEISQDNIYGLKDFLVVMVSSRRINVVQYFYENFKIHEILDEQVMFYFIKEILEFAYTRVVFNNYVYPLMSFDTIAGLQQGIKEFAINHKRRNRRNNRGAFSTAVKTVDFWANLNIAKMFIQQISESKKFDVYTKLLLFFAKEISHRGLTTQESKEMSQAIMNYVLSVVEDKTVKSDPIQLSLFLSVANEEPFQTIANDLLEKMMSQDNLRPKDISKVVDCINGAMARMGTSSILMPQLVNVCETAVSKGIINKETMESIINRVQNDAVFSRKSQNYNPF